MVLKNKFLIHGAIGAGKTTTSASMMHYGLRHHAGQGIAGQGMFGHTAHSGGWETGPSGFHLEQVSPMLKAAMDRLGEKQFPLKTLQDAVAEKGELARFRWQNEASELYTPPGEGLWTDANGIDVPSLVARLKQYRLIVLTFQAALLSVELGMKYVMGFSEIYQLPQLDYGLRDAAAVHRADLGCAEGLAVRYPTDYQGSPTTCGSNTACDGQFV